MYCQLAKDAPLAQGEIIDGCPILSRQRGADGSWEAVESIERVIILTQACDLANPKATRVQVALVHLAERLVEVGVLKPQTIRDQLTRHRVFGWYFLPAVGPMPESIVDLRDIHTVEALLLVELAASGYRQPSNRARYSLPRTPGTTFRRHVFTYWAARTLRDAN